MFGYSHAQLNINICFSMSTTTSNPFSLSGQVAVITGGGSGIGFGIAQCFVQAGARVVIVGRRENVLQEAVAQLGSSASYRVHDVTMFEKNPALIAQIESQVGNIDILINNAGVHLKKPALETTEAELQTVLNAHLVASFSLTRISAAKMVERRRGSILFIASMTSFFGVPNVIAYSAAKSAYLGIVRGLATEISGHGVRVNAIAPGWIETDMTEKAMDGDPERKSKVLGRTPMKRFGLPEDIGHAAVYLSSPAAKFVTGTALAVDGGVSIGF
jgi:NAD(P)-dependent dehydrogenase (short-subunit alcohol dehydrogenase family)